ncbi:hypothetical protein AA0616_2214 [Komagataeibacter nataicola NRIC 0616]|nr:hypothetical protein AA0616_2214 [Komagataeibacter nataicola NRIC 0616]
MDLPRLAAFDVLIGTIAAHFCALHIRRRCVLRPAVAAAWHGPIVCYMPVPGMAITMWTMP